MVRSRFLSPAILILSASLLLCGTSCKDHEKLAKQTEEVLRQVEELKAQRDASEIPDGPVKSHPIARRGKKALDSAISGVRSEVSSLENQKAALDLEIAALQKDFADYRAKNP